jgi:hypothetical protein
MNLSFNLLYSFLIPTKVWIEYYLTLYSGMIRDIGNDETLPPEYFSIIVDLVMAKVSLPFHKV